MSGALSHIRVLDLSRILAGPWAGQLLADLGAEVIKVERPGHGDDTRQWGPPYLKDQVGGNGDQAAYYLAANRGKKSVTVDIATAAGQEIVRRLAARSDILLENYKVGDLQRYGLGYDDLRTINPGLIYCSITGFGQTGPYRQRAGYDFLIQGMGGLMSVTGEPDAEGRGGPMKVGVAMVDILTGMYVSTAVLAALAHRERTGSGQYIDIALLDVQVATLANQAANYLVAGELPARLGNAHPNIVPYQAFATQDNHIILAVGNDSQFTRFCEIAGRPELALDERFASNAGRVRNRAVLIPLLEKIFLQRGGDLWIEALEAAGVPCGPINNLAQVFEDPQIRSRGMRVEVPHPLAGTVALVACPIKFSATPVAYHSAPPLLGQHTRHVLREVLGMEGEEISAFVERGIL